VTPAFELYCVASPATHHASLSQSAGKIIQWIQREEERLFIIGGAVSKSWMEYYKKKKKSLT
jgi:hypothetical protein